MSILHLPHHDGSPVRLRRGAGARRHGDRARPDQPCGSGRRDLAAHDVRRGAGVPPDDDRAHRQGGVWWEGRLTVHNPVTHYRFLVLRASTDGQSDQEWLTGAGLVGHDLLDASDFRLAAFEPAPDWGRDGVVHQIFPDLFASSATTLDEVDPLLGGDEAYARLSTAVHARGWRSLGDLTTNHTGDTHEWFLAGRNDHADPHRSYDYFADDGTYACRMGHGTLPKVNHANPALRAAMVEGPDSVVGRWLRPPYDVDGWRIDVADMTGRLGKLDLAHEVARSARGTAAQLRGDPLVIGEHNHDATGDVDGDGWHGTMNSGFSWPVWSWLRDPASPARPFGRPVPVPRRGGDAAVHLEAGTDGTTVPAADGPRLDVWALTTE